MPKFDWIQWYPDLWLHDTSCLSQYAKATWIDILMHAWNERERGVYERTFKGFCVENRMSEDQGRLVLAELKQVGNVQESNGIVTVKCRRMVRFETNRKDNMNRQAEYREKRKKQKSNRDVQKRNTPINQIKQNKQNKHPHQHPGNGGGEPSFLQPIGNNPAQIPDLVQAFIKRTAGQRPPREILSLPESMRQVLLCFKTTQDFAIDDKAWDRVYFKKLANDAEDLLDVFAGNVTLAVQCAAELGGEFRGKGLKFTLATIVKHAAEWRYKNAPKTNRP